MYRHTRESIDEPENRSSGCRRFKFLLFDRFVSIEFVLSVFDHAFLLAVVYLPPSPLSDPRRENGTIHKEGALAESGERPRPK